MTNSEAIEVLKANYPDPCFELLRDAVDTAIYALSAQPEQRWIPCSERNPDKNGIYLITITPKYLNGTAEVRQVYWSGRWARYLKKEVLAWMPLPECYRGENDGQ